MDARFRKLKGQVQLATLGLTLEETKVPGPAGLVTKSLFWTIGNLFVLN